MKHPADSIRDLFMDKPGVPVFGEGEKMHKRAYESLGITLSVLVRIDARFRNK
ncbi:MAG: hypothetical protein ACLPY1_02795 [Terracidiphilus sp.]